MYHYESDILTEYAHDILDDDLLPSLPNALCPNERQSLILEGVRLLLMKLKGTPARGEGILRGILLSSLYDMVVENVHHASKAGETYTTANVQSFCDRWDGPEEAEGRDSHPAYLNSSFPLNLHTTCA